MLICHKLVVSNEAVVLQACHVSDVHATSAVYNMPAWWDVVCCWAPHPVLSITPGFSNITTLQQRITTTTIGRCSSHTHENSIHAEQIIIILYIYICVFLAFCICYCFKLYYTEQSLLFTLTIFFYIITCGKCIK